MPLFGPLGSVIYGDASRRASSSLFGVDPDAADYAIQLGVPRPLPIPNRYALPTDQPAPGTTMTSAPTPAAAVMPAAAALPPMTSVGTFTTRRTQLFGPLAGIAI